MFEKTKCRCGKYLFDNEMIEYLQEFANGTIHVRAECPHCGNYIKYQAYGKSKTISNIVKAAYNKNLDGIEEYIARYIDDAK